MTWDVHADGWDKNPAVRAYSEAAFASLVRLDEDGWLNLDGARILDFGCGTGLLAERLSKPAKDVVAIDTSVEMVHVLNDKIGKRGLDNVKGIAKPIDVAITTDSHLFEEPFDLVMCSSVCGFLEDYPTMARTLSRLLQAGGGFEQCYNAQALVDAESMLVMVPHVTQAGNDKGQGEPKVERIQALPEGLEQPEQLLADTGFFSEHNVQCCRGAGIEPLIAVGRDGHHPHWRSRFEEAAPLERPATHTEQMKHALKTQAGRAAYALRKQTVEPVFGIIKSVMGFRQFGLRGLDNVRNEWTLVCLAWNFKRMAVLCPQ